MINKEIFREYDIRGIAERDLTSPVIEALGRAFADYLRPKGINAVTVGYDARISSPRLCDDIVRGLTMSGMDVTITRSLPDAGALFLTLSPEDRRGGDDHREPQSSGVQRVQALRRQGDDLRRRNPENRSAHELKGRIQGAGFRRRN